MTFVISFKTAPSTSTPPLAPIAPLVRKLYMDFLIAHRLLLKLQIQTNVKQIESALFENGWPLLVNRFAHQAPVSWPAFQLMHVIDASTYKGIHVSKRPSSQPVKSYKP